MGREALHEKWRVKHSNANNLNTRTGDADFPTGGGTALIGDATFTGTWERNDYPDVMVTCKADVAGTLYFDFSDDNGTTVSTFPVNGFTVAAGIYEFHSAVKGMRWFRVRLVNGSAAQATCALNTYFGTFKQGNLPLNQSISSDADAIITRSVLVGQASGGDYLNVPVSGEGALRVDVPKTAFGEIKAESKTPQVQLRFPYNVVPPDIGQVLTNNASSSVTVADAQASVTCAGAYPAFSQIRTQDTLRYGPGQGAEFLGTCAFTAGVALSSQVFGPGDDDEGLYFGYNGTSFGVMRRAYGSLEIKSLEITAGADGTGGTFTITMDGTAVTITVLANDTIAEVCAAIVAAQADFFNAGRGWEVHTDDNVSVEFISLVAENASGSFSFADVDSGVTATGGFVEDVAGVAPTETWVAQADWNGDKMDGTGVSGMTLDPTKGNVYKIQFQYLGYGAQEFFIEDQLTGYLQLVHTFKYTNQNTVPWCLEPSIST